MAGSDEVSATLVNGNNTTHNTSFDSIASCIESFAAGNFLIVLDSPSRENEGDLIIAARHLTPSKAAFMIRYTSGYLCAPMSTARAKLLDLPPMVPMHDNADPNRTAYAVTVDAVNGSWEDYSASGGAEESESKGNREGFYADGIITTGISAHDRSVTCRILADSRARLQHLRRPGHVVPLTARDGGVRARRGHTEAGWEFARLAGIEPEVAVIGEMVVDGEPIPIDGSGDSDGGVGAMAELGGSGMMRMEECLEFGTKWGIKCCTIEDLAAYVEEKEGKLANGS